MTVNEEFSDFDDKPALSMLPQSTGSLQNLTVGQYILANYKGELYPGKDHRDETVTKYSSLPLWSHMSLEMTRKPDEIKYSKGEIMCVINQPKQIKCLGIYSVNELWVYNELLSF